MTANTLTDEEVGAWLADPSAYACNSYTTLHSLPHENVAALQFAGAQLRFAQHTATIPMLAKLAERQGVDAIERVEDLLPLLFEHTMYKSYPQILLERSDFKSMTRWFDKLTSHDLSALDASGCESIDEWLTLLDTDAGLDPSFSSGTTGTMSFIPWSSRDLRNNARQQRVSRTQTFERAPDEVLNVPFHYATMVNRNRRDYISPAMGLGHEEYGHVFEPEGQSADLLWLGTRLRLAAARGDASRVDVPPSLLARKAEFERRQQTAAQRKREWIDSLIALRGAQIIWSAHPYAIVEIAGERLRQGQHCEFGPGSMLHLTGGAKGHTLPHDWLETVKEFVNMPVAWVYGMAEVSATAKQCAHGRYHLPPWVVPFILDPDTSRLKPRQGVQTGRFAFFDLLPTSHWGGFVTGDELEIDFDGACSCGATSLNAAFEVTRLSEKHGGDDKITCAASPAAHAEAMAYLVET
jgi:hypothetical protein